MTTLAQRAPRPLPPPPPGQLTLPVNSDLLDWPTNLNPFADIIPSWSYIAPTNDFPTTQIGAQWFLCGTTNLAITKTNK